MTETGRLAAAAFALLIAAQTLAQPQPAPKKLFSLELRNDVRSALGQDRVTTPNLELRLLGNGQNIIVATGERAHLPRLFFGLCKGPCGFLLRDQKRELDLRGRANIKFTTIVSGFHRVRPVISLDDGTVLICDQAEGSTADFHEYEISFSDCRWLKLDPDRGVTLGATWVDPDLSRVDAVGVFDVIPGSGEWPIAGAPVQKQPPPPAGGWIAISSLELWGQATERH